MAVGFATTKQDVDGKSGSLSRMIASWATDTIAFQEGFMEGATEQALTDLGYTTDDVALLKSAMSDLYKLAKVFRGEQDQTPAYDFRTFSGRLTGATL